jgi:drug/metabolite transporter (DMT)-like permease
MKRTSVYLALMTQVGISAMTYLLAKQAFTSFTPIEVLLLRVVGSSVLFAGLLLLLPRPRLPARSEIIPVLLLGLLGAPINQGFFLLGLQRSTPNHAALLYALTPLIVFTIAVLCGQERASASKLAGIALGLAGVVIILSDGGGSIEADVRAGDLLILVGVLAWALFSTFGRPLAAQRGAVRFTCWTSLAACVLSLPMAPFALDAGRLAAATPRAWAIIAFLCVLTSFVSYLLWTFALERIESSRVTVWSNLQPVVTAALSWLVLSTPVTGAFALGGGMVIAGVLVTQRE